MKIAFTYNCRRSDSEEEAEFDSPETIAAIEAALAAGGHEVIRIEVGDETPLVVAARLRAAAPHLIFNTVEGQHGRTREAQYPMLFEALGIPFVGSDAYVLTVTLDKWLTKLVVAAHGVPTPRSLLLRAADEQRQSRLQRFHAEVALPVIVKPNYEGSSKGIEADSIVTSWTQLLAIVDQQLQRYPDGVLVEEYVAGCDVTVPIVQGLGAAGDDGVLTPCGYEFSSATRSSYPVYGYGLKNLESHHVSVRCPAALEGAVLERLRNATVASVRALGIRDLGRADFRVSDSGEIRFLEINALPSLEPGASLFSATAELGLTYGETLLHLVEHAAGRQKAAGYQLLMNPLTRSRVQQG